MGIKKTARVGILLSCLPVTSSQLFVKSPLASLIMLFRTIFIPLSSRNILCSKKFIDWTILNLPSTMKIGQ